ncbi:metallophosphoesterase 1 [Chanos chanos]|uniref:Metallophosphoesterase 1 n=1 Tax=Chanos chanos TaxID=29144 RepID=A0A6J2UYZ0_CHACN|nr:metallophosphoesterase 1 [Chanos chanos]
MFGLSGRGRLSIIVLLILTVTCVFIFCEYVIYYPAILRCSWPEMTASKDPAAPLRALFLSDTHLLGAVRGHWFDKLRREWQMERSFQTALRLLRPEIVFILGDVFDEGKWSSTQAWDDDVRRFRRIFRHHSDTELVVLVGNHDVGFHHEMTQHKLERFENVFNISSARILTTRGVNFLLVNSVAMHGDHCPICRSVENELHRLSEALNCSLQHYPLYRPSDAECTGVDAALPEERYQPFEERYDVLSQDASRKLLWWFQPRLILSGHTHSGCEVLHENKIPEVSVPSFSWRNRNNPSFILGSISQTDFALSKCFLPEETSVIVIYCGSALIMVLIAISRLTLFTGPLHFSSVLLSKHKPL